MSRENTDIPEFDPDLFPEDHTDDCGSLADWPDSDSLAPGEQAHVLAAIEDELIAIGLHAGRLQRAAGSPQAAAVWEAAPDGCPVGGAVWERIRRGVAIAYAEPHL